MVTLKKAVRVMIWVIGGLGIAFFALVVYRMFVLREKERTMEQVARIHATRLTLDDVMGRNLPPDPGTDADKTIRGIDANHNGIRDDVELAIFREYPGSAKTRAVLLQYALALQMEATQTIVNRETVTAVAEDEGRSYACVGKITSRDNIDKYGEIVDARRKFIETRQLNTDARKKAQHDFYEGNLGSFTLPHESCDIDISTLPD